MESTSARRIEHTVEVTLQAIRDVLSDEMLRDLLDHNFSPQRTVRIKRESYVSEFAEDCMLPTKLTRTKKKKTKGKKKPKLSEKFDQAIIEFEGGNRTCDSHVVLGYYFKQYKSYFHEEDPNWSGVSLQRAHAIVNRMAEVTDGDYTKLAKFVRKIIPLWARRLKKGHDFPKDRPNLESLFGGTRYFWANRNLLMKRWARED